MEWPEKTYGISDDAMNRDMVGNDDTGAEIAAANGGSLVVGPDGWLPGSRPASQRVLRKAEGGGLQPATERLAAESMERTCP